MGEETRDRVKERYAGAALTVLEGAGRASCCGSSAGERGLDSEALGVDWTCGGYSAEELKELPQAAGVASLGLGDKGRLPAELLRSMEAWSGCVSGALEKDEYERFLGEVGFEDVSVEVTHTYEEEFAEASGCCGDSARAAATVEVPLGSAFIRGRKPSGSAS